MATRYDGNDSSGTLDLELVDRLTEPGETLFGDLCDLVAWHLVDPISSEEVTRNGIIYSWQGNRNPFVDHPEYVVSIWGEECGIVLTPDLTPVSKRSTNIIPIIKLLLL